MRKNVMILSITTVLLGLFFLPASGKEKNRNRGRIVLAGVVHAPYGQNDGGSELAEGIGGVPEVTVEIVGADHQVQTDRNGFFFFTKAPDGEVVVQLTKPGFKSVSKTVEVDSGSLDPAQVSIQMMPDGMASDGKSLSGTGVVYVAYSKDEQIIENSGAELPIWELLKRLAAGGDPMDITRLMNQKEQNPLDRKANTYTVATDHVMIYPPKTPSRSTFHKLNTSPYYLSFDATGSHLYVADNTSTISILDASDRHKRLSMVPLQPGSRVTSLSRSPNNEYILATVMGALPGVLVIHTGNQQPQAFLNLDGLGNAVPKSATEAGGHILVTAGAPGAPGKLMAVDPYTGATVTEIEVGEMPLSVSVTGDGRFAYVANSRGGNVSVIDLQKMENIGTIAAGVSPFHTAISGNLLLVANQGGDSVTVIDTTAQRVVSVIEEVGKAPTMIALAPDEKTAYVTNRDDHTIATIDLETLKVVHVSDPMPFSKPTGIAIRP